MPGCSVSESPGSRVKPNPPDVTGHYFTTTRSQFDFPELSSQGAWGVADLLSRPNIGVALAGGGYRAATLACGWINGMRQLGLLDKVRYLSSNSGASWFTAAFAYQPASTAGEPSHDDSFFAEYLDPKLLTLDAISAGPPSGSFLNIITENQALALFGDAAIKAIGGEDNCSSATAWSQAVASTFLAPFGLGSLGGTVSMGGTNGNVYERVREILTEQASTADICLAKPGPFPVMVASVYTLKTNDPVTQFYPFEFTPLYFGMPSLQAKVQPFPLGGGYTEPFMADSGVPEQPKLKPSPDGKQVATVAVNNLVPLALVSGISSSFFAAAIYLLIRKIQGIFEAHATADADGLETTEVCLELPDLKDENVFQLLEEGRGGLRGGLTPEGETWVTPPITTEVLGLFDFQDGDVKGGQVPFADGGGNDNLALYPLLRRRVEHVVLLVACVSDVNNPSYESNGTYNYGAAASDFFDVAQVFAALPEGAQVNGQDTSTLNANAQVFDNAGWKELVDVMRTKVTNGEPASFRKTYTVMRNDFHFMQGGWEVDVLWVWNQKCTNWEDQLPSDTRTKLDSERTAATKGGKESIIVPLDFASTSIFHWVFNWLADVLAVKNLGSYPLLTTYTSQIAPAPANMLYQQAGWTIKEGVGQEIKDMVAAAEGRSA